MSASKFKYFDVSVVNTVKALNQTDAIKLATSNSSSRTPGKVMAQAIVAERVSAQEAHDWAEQVTSA